KSVACAPIWRPTLPPFKSKYAGSLHPAEVRQLATPRPPRAPRMNPALMTCGKTAMQTDLSSTVLGIALSGAAMISWKTLEAFDACDAASSLANEDVGMTIERHNTPKRQLINLSFISPPVTWFVALNCVEPPAV